MENLKHCLSANEIGNCLGGMTVQGVYRILKSHEIETIQTSSNRKLIPPASVRKLFSERGFSYPKQNISFQIVKGGVGKTSLSFSLAVRASHYGAKVLLIDLDQQANLTRSFDIESRTRPVWLNIIRNDSSLENAIVKINNNIDIIPSNLNNSRLDIELAQTSFNMKDMIRDHLKSIRDNYDLVIMDCPPAINKINTAACCGSDLVIIPINPDPYAMDGLDYTIHEIDRIKKEFKLNTDYKIIWNRYDARERLGAVFMHELAKNENRLEKIIPVVIKSDISLKNAVYFSKSVFELSKKSQIREDLDQFTKEILGLSEWGQPLGSR